MWLNIANFKKVILILSLVLYVISLPFSFAIGEDSGIGTGITALTAGWIGLLMLYPPAFCWLANPLLFFAWRHFLNGKIRLSVILSTWAVILATCFLMCRSITVNEGGTERTIASYGVGYWLWLASMLVMMLGNMIIYWSKTPVEESEA